MKHIRHIKDMKDGKSVNMKKLFRRNQIIVTTLAVMIAAAGYLNYAGTGDLTVGGGAYEAGVMEISDEDILAEAESSWGSGGAPGKSLVWIRSWKKLIRCWKGKHCQEGRNL